MPRVSASKGHHVRLKTAALPILRQLYSDLDADALWAVKMVDGGRGRDALLLTAGDREILAWRNQVRPLPRCDYCGQEGHSNSTGTAKTCSVRAAEVQETRAAASARMKARWAAKKGSGSVPPLGQPGIGAGEPTGAELPF